QGLKRMFLHSAETTLRHPLTEEPLKLLAPLPRDLESYLETLRTQYAQAI
ncbi:MAG TPA: RNA pseudouridine synthase, partial [Gallionella sp.]|nr:RNA pseudouridine synthase [Gallionella sp.]